MARDGAAGPAALTDGALPQLAQRPRTWPVLCALLALVLAEALVAVSLGASGLVAWPVPSLKEGETWGRARIIALRQAGDHGPARVLPPDAEQRLADAPGVEAVTPL